MIYLVYALHILVCVFLILVVLLQQGKGADLSVFGGGSTQTAFGARGATTFLHKLTVASFIVFVLTTLWLGLPRLGGGGSVLHGTASGKTGDTGKPGKNPAGSAGGARPAPLNRPAAAVPVNPAPAQKLPSAATAPPPPATAAPQPATPTTPTNPAAPAAKPVAGGNGSAPTTPPSPPPH